MHGRLSDVRMLCARAYDKERSNVVVVGQVPGQRLSMHTHLNKFMHYVLGDFIMSFLLYSYVCAFCMKIGLC